jgi:Immunity protein 26
MEACSTAECPARNVPIEATLRHNERVKAEPPINLRRLRRRGRRPVAGDLFTVRLPDGDHLFGRVVDGPSERGAAPMAGSYLIYVYKHRSTKARPDLGRLKPDALLIPPVFVNHRGWTKGYFKVVGHEPIRDEDLVPTACFQDRLKGCYRNPTGTRIQERAEPCGIWATGNHRTLDNDISHALGLEPAQG